MKAIIEEYIPDAVAQNPELVGEIVSYAQNNAIPPKDPLVRAVITSYLDNEAEDAKDPEVVAVIADYVASTQPDDVTLTGKVLEYYISDGIKPEEVSLIGKLVKAIAEPDTEVPGADELPGLQAFVEDLLVSSGVVAKSEDGTLKAETAYADDVEIPTGTEAKTPEGQDLETPATVVASKVTIAGGTQADVDGETKTIGTEVTVIADKVTIQAGTTANMPEGQTLETKETVEANAVQIVAGTIASMGGESALTTSEVVQADNVAIVAGTVATVSGESQKLETEAPVVVNQVTIDGGASIVGMPTASMDIDSFVTTEDTTYPKVTVDDVGITFAGADENGEIPLSVYADYPGEDNYLHVSVENNGKFNIDFTGDLNAITGII